MHAYVHCICPQFTQTDINFQRVPVVDTSNPFIARWIRRRTKASSSSGSATRAGSTSPT
jgi:phosphoribulokinase